jgi:hypothetical protein
MRTQVQDGTIRNGASASSKQCLDADGRGTAAIAKGARNSIFALLGQAPRLGEEVNALAFGPKRAARSSLRRRAIWRSQAIKGQTSPSVKIL